MKSHFFSDTLACCSFTRHALHWCLMPREDVGNSTSDLNLPQTEHGLCLPSLSAFSCEPFFRAMGSEKDVVRVTQIEVVEVKFNLRVDVPILRFSLQTELIPEM